MTTSRVTLVRRFVALACAVGAVAVALGGRLFGWEFCTDELARLGTRAVVATCGPPTLADVSPLFALALVLLLPDLEEVGLPGGGSLKLRLTAQEGRQEELVAEVRGIQQTLVQQVTSSNTQQVIMVPHPQVALSTFPEKLAQFEATARDDGAGGVGWPDWADTYEQEVKELRELAAALAPWQFLGPRLQNPSWRSQVRQALATAPDLDGYTDRIRRLVDRLSDRDAQIVARWWEVFDTDLSIVRASVASLAKVGAPDPDGVRSALELAHGLRDSLAAEVGVEPTGPLP